MKSLIGSIALSKLMQHLKFLIVSLNTICLYSILVLVVCACGIQRFDNSTNTHSVFKVIKKAQDYDDYVRVIDTQEVLPTKNFDGEPDTLVLYRVQTKLAIDQFKIKNHLRLTFLSNPYQFYQMEIDHSIHHFKIGELNSITRSIEILRNNQHYKLLTQLNGTIVE
ncbi:MAG: hypothetical protein JXQ87_00965 [Bacteroidia bacterium]